MNNKINIDFVNAICKSKEANLISIEKFERIISSENPEEALRIIKENGFGKDVKTDSALDYESLIKKEEDSLVDFIKEYAPYNYFIDLFLCEYDYHNAESILRAKYLKINEIKLLRREGKFSIAQLKDFILGKKKCVLSKNLELAINESAVLFENDNATGFLISNIFIKAKYKEKIFLSIQNKALNNYVKIEIDLINISTDFRSRDERIFELSFIDGGNMSYNQLKDLASLDYGIIIGKFKGHIYEKFIVLAAESAKIGRPFIEFETLKDSYALSELIKDKYIVYGFKEFMLYCFYKLNEIKNVRIVMSGLINKLEKNDIKIRVRENYAG